MLKKIKDNIEKRKERSINKENEALLHSLEGILSYTDYKEVSYYCKGKALIHMAKLTKNGVSIIMKNKNGKIVSKKDMSLILFCVNYGF